MKPADGFNKNNRNRTEENFNKNLGNFNVFRLEDGKSNTLMINYSRPDCYKIGLIRGRKDHYKENKAEMENTILTFFSPETPNVGGLLSGDCTGFICIFRKSFFSEIFRYKINALPIFKSGGEQAQHLTEGQDRQLSEIFEKMERETASDYLFKDDLIRNYLAEIIHTALKISRY